MNDVFAPSSTPSTGRIIDCVSPTKSYHTFIADVTNAYFHVDEDEECHVDPAAEWMEQEAALENSTSVLLAAAKTAVWSETRWNTLGRHHGRAP